MLDTLSRDIKNAFKKKRTPIYVIIWVAILLSQVITTILLRAAGFSAATTGKPLPSSSYQLLFNTSSLKVAQKEYHEVDGRYESFYNYSNSHVGLPDEHADPLDFKDFYSIHMLKYCSGKIGANRELVTDYCSPINRVLDWRLINSWKSDWGIDISRGNISYAEISKDKAKDRKWRKKMFDCSAIENVPQRTLEMFWTTFGIALLELIINAFGPLASACLAIAIMLTVFTIELPYILVVRIWNLYRKYPFYLQHLITATDTKMTAWVGMTQFGLLWAVFALWILRIVLWIAFLCTSPRQKRVASRDGVEFERLQTSDKEVPDITGKNPES